MHIGFSAQRVILLEDVLIADLALEHHGELLLPTKIPEQTAEGARVI